jgi:hypothetical protein
LAKQSQVNKNEEAQAAAARAQEQQAFTQLMAPTPEQTAFRTGMTNFNNWIGAKDYSKAPEGSILNFDLMSPAHAQQQQERMGNLTGIGATALGGSGDQSTALQLAKEHNANVAGQNAGQAWEDAIHNQDQYYKSGGLAYAGLDTQRTADALNNASSREMGYNDQYVQTRPRSILPSIFGGRLGAGSAFLSNPALAAM